MATNPKGIFGTKTTLNITKREPASDFGAVFLHLDLGPRSRWREVKAVQTMTMIKKHRSKSTNVWLHQKKMKVWDQT